VKWFTKLDIIDAYNYICITEGEEWKIVFRIKFRYFKYLVMLFRLTNALSSFKRFIKEVLYKVLYYFIVVYLDNILIFSKDKDKHVEYIKEVL
jgi:hypothetical protein